MDISKIYRIAGISLVASATVATAATIFQDEVVGGDKASFAGHPLFVPADLAVRIATTILLYGFIASYARQASRAGWLGLIGFVPMLAAGMMFTVGSAMLHSIVLPALYASSAGRSFLEGPPAPAIVAYFTAAGLFQLVGLVLYGVATWRAGVFPRWAGAVLVASGVAGIVTPLHIALPGLLDELPVFLLFAGFAWIGVALASDRTAERPAVVGAGGARSWA